MTMYGLYDFLVFLLNAALLVALAAILAALIAWDRKQTLGFLVRGVPEVNPLARALMSHWLNPQDGYGKGARIYFSLCFAAVAAITTFGLLVPSLCWLAECALIAWLLPQAYTVWRNRRKGYSRTTP